MESLYAQMLQHMINRGLSAELDAHLAAGSVEAGSNAGRSNKRNGKSVKTVQSANGSLTVETPRDRLGTFEPQLVKKRQVRLVADDANVLRYWLDRLHSEIAGGNPCLAKIKEFSGIALPLSDSIELREIRSVLLRINNESELFEYAGGEMNEYLESMRYYDSLLIRLI